MRVDLGGTTASQITSEQSGQLKKTSGQATNISSLREDTTSFSSDSASVSDLTAKAMATPEIRQDKVDALKQQISSGNYKIEPGKIADAILDEMA